MKENKELQCAACRRALQEGLDVFEVCEGLIGIRDFVPLQQPMYFCCSDCLKDYFSAGAGYLPKAPKRVP